MNNQINEISPITSEKINLSGAEGRVGPNSERSECSFGQNGPTLGQFIETRLGKTFEDWLDMTPIEFFREFWNLNLDKIEPDKLSEFFDNLESSDDSSDDIKNDSIRLFARPEENLELWNSKLDDFIRDIVDPDHEMREFLQLVREKLPQETIPIRYELMYDGTGTGYFRLTQPIPTNRYCWFWDKYHRMILQVEDHIYFQRYTNIFSCLMMGKIKPEFSNSCFNNQCYDETFKDVFKKVRDFDLTTYYQKLDKDFYSNGGTQLESGEIMKPEIKAYAMGISSRTSTVPYRKEGSDEDPEKTSCLLL